MEIRPRNKTYTITGVFPLLQVEIQKIDIEEHYMNLLPDAFQVHKLRRLKIHKKLVDSGKQSIPFSIFDHCFDQAPRYIVLLFKG